MPTPARTAVHPNSAKIMFNCFLLNECNNLHKCFYDE